MLYNKNAVSCFIKRMKDISKVKSIYIFGAGNVGKMIGRFFNINQIEWLGYIDNNSNLWGKYVEEHGVYNIQEIEDFNRCYVLISISTDLYSDQVKLIESQLISFGLNRNLIECIYHDLDLTNAIDYLICDGDRTLQRNRVLKNIYKGKRCFVIGNGPSLSIPDLDKLINEVTFSCNNSIQLLNRTMWKPTCFFGADHIFVNKYVNTDEKIESILSSCKYMFTNFRSGLYSKYHYKYDNLFYLYLYRTSNLFFSEDMSRNTVIDGSSIFVLLQLAVYMGINEIYLLGCDYSFQQELKSDGKLIVNKEIQTHMKYMDQAIEGRYRVDAILNEYLCAKEYAETHGIKIYNATRGGRLEVFERVDFDDLF